MRARVWFAGLIAAALSACGTFDSASPAPTDGGIDGGTEAAVIADSGERDGSNGEAGAGRDGGCPSDQQPNTKCWDFDEGDVPGGTKDDGDLALDSTTSKSPGRSLLATTKAIPSDDLAWAYLEQPIANAPAKVTLDLWLRVPSQAETQIGIIRLQGGNVEYTIALVANAGSLKANENVSVSTNPTRNVDRPLGGTSGNWQHVLIELEVSGLGTPAAKRRLLIIVDETPVYDDANDDLGLSVLMPSQTLVRAGITRVSSYGGNTGADRRLNLDDVKISWTP